MNIRTILFIVIISFPTVIVAQKSKPWHKPLYDMDKFHYGFAFSAGVMDFSVSYADKFLTEGSGLDSVLSVEGSAKSAFGASAVGILRLSPHLNLRFMPGLYFGQRDLQYLLVAEDSSIYYHSMKIESTLLQFPLLIKYRAIRQNNYRPYVIFGANYAIDFAASKKNKAEDQPKIRLNKHDVFLEVGVGVDYYLPYFKLSTEIKFSYGLLDMVNYDGTQYTSVFNRLGSKMVTLVILIE